MTPTPTPFPVFEAKTLGGITWSIVSEADYRRYSRNPNYMVRIVFKET